MNTTVPKKSSFCVFLAILAASFFFGWSAYAEPPIPGSNAMPERGVRQKTPVVIVPGIMSSFSSCLFRPDCPDDYIWNPTGPINTTLDKRWVLDPIKIDHWYYEKERTYQSLIEELEDAGYVRGKDLFPLPYDWRQRNEDTARDTLAAAVDRIKKKTGSEKIDLIAHSMGGLVARYFIEVMDRSDVRKLVLLGTPNRGSAKAYYPWEGGDFSIYGYFQNSLFFQPLIKQMKIGYGYEDKPDYEFIRKEVPSVRQLLSINGYLKREVDDEWKTIPIRRMLMKNPLLSSLKARALLNRVSGDNLRIYYGTELSTPRFIYVRPWRDIPKEAREKGLWMDGEPVSDPESDSGDGTVLVGSAVMAGVAAVEKREVEHGELPDACKADVVEFLTGKPPAKASVEAGRVLKTAKEEAQGLLFFGTRDKVLMAVTTPEGARVGRFPDIDHMVSELELSYYAGTEGQTDALGLYNLSEGAYRLTISTREIKVRYRIFLSYTDAKDRGEQKTVIEGKVRQGEEKTHTVSVGAVLRVE